MTTPAATAAAAGLRLDDRAWDAFVAGSPQASYLQLTAWARVKAANGWRAERVLVEGPDGPVGLQLLVRQLGRLGVLGYAPRGPVGAAFDALAVTRLTESLVALGRAADLVAVTIEPQLPAGDPMEGWLAAAGWRSGPRVQDPTTRLIDLSGGSAGAWAGLRSKWRQYVEKARRAGVTVEEAGPEGLDDFYRIYRDTAARTGFVIRAASAYRDVYDAFAVQGACRLLLARLPDGEPVATLLLVACGPRMTELYGGMTPSGGEARANYLLKWEAIRAAADGGFSTYDLWGLATPGIAHFKAGYGGHEVRYLGAYDLVLQPRRLASLRALAATRERLARWRIRGSPAGDDGAG